MATKVVMEALSPTMEEGRLVKWLKNEGDPGQERRDDRRGRDRQGGHGARRARRRCAAQTTARRGRGRARRHALAVIAAQTRTSMRSSPVRGAAPAGAAPAPAARRSQANETAGQSGAAQRSRRRARPRRRRRKRSRHTARVPRTAAAPPQSGPPAARVRAWQQRRPHAVLAARPPHGVASSGVDLQAFRAAAPAAGSSSATSRARSGAGGSRSRSLPRVRRPTRARGRLEDVPLTQIRKTIARRLVGVDRAVPTFYLTAEFDMDARRRRCAPRWPRWATSTRSRSTTSSSRPSRPRSPQHPEVNAHWLGDKIRYFNRVHIGMAVAIEDGLITPVHLRRRPQAHERDLARGARARRSARASGSSSPRSTRARRSRSRTSACSGSTSSRRSSIRPKSGILAIGARRGEAGRGRRRSSRAGSACASR